MPLPSRSFQIEELTLKSSATTELKILFDEPWLVQFSHARLKGDVPVDREWSTLSALCSECRCVDMGCGWEPVPCGDFPLPA